MTSTEVVVIGGGAAGFFGAIHAAQAPHTRVTLLEAGRQPLAKVRISGGGRCNVTHHCFEPSQLVLNYPRGSKALRGAFSRFQALDVVRWFNAEGVKLKTEADGRMFPVTDDSETIVEALMFAAKKTGVVLRNNVLVQKIERLESDKGDSKFEVILKNGENILCDRLLLATGSSPSGYAIARSLGHELEPPVPSLFTFNIKDSKLHELAGVSVNPATVKLLISNSNPEKKKSARNQLEQSGALLITHWGLSGPAVLKLSAWAARELHDCNYQAKLAVNWIPSLKVEAIKQILLSAKTEQPKKFVSNYCPVDISLRLWEYLLDKAEVELEKRWADISNRAIQQIVNVLSTSEYAIAGKGVFKEEFVTCGGIRLQDVNFQTMESKICQGLFFAGEVLDIDGVTGGFNFQSAWTTAWIAAQGINAEFYSPLPITKNADQ
ncbi:MAG: NAD(P)/FAD-dependent oxidoreductase [Pseudanabaena sp. M135S2SP2A07QC]|nr:NAD(P)/FAD-dependent oxidoreductase [Chitinophagaceae bacterium]MCA6501140.1 NAD(P)/FAD-dependent oxidoreductase [Pseudanabaena sp. M090S1SP2A07QC]MCA6507044.1 NAD(P)/FAD-dependent oxidoreductase [Pseudanabaena sp. M172S2SP2A07QC]MCA6523736.1 NAD(P)/FAD-dependent oxidoreductase [Pseudanabaena sp. M051S1SP2A07QC]MCA6531034.1 NAD(P)/FAD-dependent oxidoreductase [Pseudanabaena sp. M125S2SP2A07QC]MCA6534364.1 NAD(P)/FAD-dependent oxidoreductase [Pseudanabaena sp. M176S2SP2A07QC]MCA6537693.1 NA